MHMKNQPIKYLAIPAIFYTTNISLNAVYICLEALSSQGSRFDSF